MRPTPCHGNPYADVASQPANRDQWTTENGWNLSWAALYPRVAPVSSRSTHNLDLIDPDEPFTFPIGWRRPHPAAQSR